MPDIALRAGDSYKGDIFSAPQGAHKLMGETICNLYDSLPFYRVTGKEKKMLGITQFLKCWSILT